jgi:ribonuclease P protein component
MQEAAFPKQRRLLTPAAFRPVFQQTSRKAGDRCFLILAKENQETYHRLGLAIAKKQLARAVDRNRIKRLAREAFRQLEAQAPALDMVVLARSGLREADNRTVTSSLNTLFHRLTETRGNTRRETP